MTTPHDFEEALRVQVQELRAMANDLDERAPPWAAKDPMGAKWQRDAWIAAVALRDAAQRIDDALVTLARARLRG